jgi:hypothetical protein
MVLEDAPLVLSPVLISQARSYLGRRTMPARNRERQDKSTGT